MELLSPAGGLLQAKSAVISGADAIYLGAQAFSARSHANNFSREELAEIVAFCHLRDVDVHLAVNTLILNKEMEEAENLVRYAREIGIDAFIVQDIGLIRRIREIAPDVPIHGSTQMTICNLQGARIAKEMGLSRVVLARELSLREITEITKHSDLEIEVFVHGAICVSYSGQCLLSSMLGGRSGNRGNCAQPCRKEYRYQNRNGYFLSPADMCHLPYLKELSDAGVASIKIEGRMKSPEYVSTVTRIYRKYLNQPGTVSEEDMRVLKNSFCRGDSFTDGYLTEQSGDKMMRPDTSNDDILKKRDTELLNQHSLVYREGLEHTNVSISGSFCGKIGEIARYSVKDAHGRYGSATGKTPVEAAKSAPVPKERIFAQLSKLGGTPYVLESLSIEWDGGFLPINEINEMRRNAIADLSAKRVAAKRREALPVAKRNEALSTNLPEMNFSLQAIVSDSAQLTDFVGTNLKRVFVPLGEYAASRNHWKGKIGVYMPLNLSTSELNDAYNELSSHKPDCLLCTNLSHIDIAKQLNVPAIAGFQLNIYNSEALREAFTLGVSESILSVELNEAQIMDIKRKRPLPIYTIGYGKLPLMTTKNCLIRTATGGCNCDREIVISDQKHVKLRLMKGNAGGTVILNHTPLYIGDQMDRIRTACDGVILLFTDETPKECRAILEEYAKIRLAHLPTEYTRGHFNRGV